MAAVRWTRHLKQLCWSTSTIGQRRDGTYMSVSSSSNFLRERHRTTHCYLSGIHIIYRTQVWYPQDSSWDHHSQSLFGRTILKVPLLSYWEKRPTHFYICALPDTFILYCFLPSTVLWFIFTQRFIFWFTFTLLSNPPVRFCNRPILRNCPQATSGQLT